MQKPITAQQVTLKHLEIIIQHVEPKTTAMNEKLPADTEVSNTNNELIQSPNSSIFQTSPVQSWINCQRQRQDS